ncbi:hypothetical protein [Brucella tritici]|uniref:hypothetical protein n=1 Tax=Brucella tritici TaxID=94626 RepID=UPI00178C6D7F|nr:hypothetical protein [Brucella tritici]
MKPRPPYLNEMPVSTRIMDLFKWYELYGFCCQCGHPPLACYVIIRDDRHTRSSLHHFWSECQAADFTEILMICDDLGGSLTEVSATSRVRIWSSKRRVPLDQHQRRFHNLIAM